MNKIKYYMQYPEKQYHCSVELLAKTHGGAKKLAKSIAKQENIHRYEIAYKLSNGLVGLLK